MKFMVKKCLFMVLVMSASVSLPMFNGGQQGQAQAQQALDQNDPIVQALNFYQCTNTLLDAGKSLYNVIKPVFGLAASLDADANNPWRKTDAENSFKYIHRMLAHVTTLYGYSLYSRGIGSKAFGHTTKFIKESILEDFSKDFNEAYGKGCLDRAIMSFSHKDEWRDRSQKAFIKHEKNGLEKGLKALCAAKSIVEKTKIRRKLLLQYHPDKVRMYKFDEMDASSVKLDFKAKRHMLYASMINKVATDQGVTK